MADLASWFRRVLGMKPYTPWTGSIVRDRNRDKVADRRPWDKGQMSMADEWAPGDLALCVSKDDGGPWVRPDGWDINPGTLYRVASVHDFHPIARFPVLTLQEDPLRACWGWGSIAFRKINPLTDEETRETLVDLEQDQRVADLERAYEGAPR